MNNDKRCKIVLVVTSPASMFFFKGQIKFLIESGFNVAVVCSPGWNNVEGFTYYPIPMVREISVFRDLKALINLINLFIKIKPDIVHAGTPKAGLLASIAAYIVRVPIRIYTNHGLRLETLKGVKRIILTITEYLSAFCSTHVVCVSESLRGKFINLKLASKDKITVIGKGSCNGIDLNRFDISINESKLIYDSIINRHKLPPDAYFIGFIGRLTKDKGIFELIDCFENLKKKFPKLYLLLIGDYEEGDPIPEEMRKKIDQDIRIIRTGYIDNVEPYYHLIKVLLLPTYREGFPTVVLEAGSARIPVVASRVTGCIDAVVDGVTGFLFPVGDSEAMAALTEKLLLDDDMAIKIGENARFRIQQHYSSDIVWNNIKDFYKKLLGCRI